MRKKIIIFALLLVIILIASPKIYSFINEIIYNKNHIVTYTSLSEINILDKFTDDDYYYLKISLESEYFIEKYNIEDNIRTYKIEDKELFNEIEPDRNEEYIGITIESVIDKRSFSEDDITKIKEDPFLVISSEKYSDHISVINISK